MRRKAKNKTVNVDAIPKLNSEIKVASLIASFSRLLNNSKPTASQGCNQSTGECLENQLT